MIPRAGLRLGLVGHVRPSKVGPGCIRAHGLAADCSFAGAVYLKATTYSPVNPEPVLQVHNAAVVVDHRRRGIGKALVEAAVTWAEELGIGHVATAAASGSREANRFMARLALGPQAVLRMAPTGAVRAKLVGRCQGSRQVTQVLAARRSLRNARSVSNT